MKFQHLYFNGSTQQRLSLCLYINNWIATLEAIRVPRNLVGHMNFPNSFDKAAIDSAYSRLPSLLRQLASHHVSILTPR